MKIPLIDLVAQYHSVQPEIDRAIHEVLEDGAFVLGGRVAAFEEAMASYLGVEHAVGVASGTDALILALEALDVGPGDEVLCPAYTFFATAEAILRVGATPVFVDVDPDTYCIDTAEMAARITPRTRAVIPVHLYGHPAGMTAVAEIAREHGLAVIEDNAQSLGASWAGRKTGTWGDAGCLSFFPSKQLGAYGDAGMVVTDRAEIAERVRLLRTHGWRDKYFPELLGHNSRLDALQAAVLRVKLRHLDDWNDARRLHARRYAEMLAAGEIGLPVERPEAEHAYHLFVVRVGNRDEVVEELRRRGIACAVYYPVPLHLMRPCAHLGHRAGDFPVSEKAAGEALAIPLYAEMTAEQLDEVAAALLRAVESASQRRTAEAT